MFGDLGGAGGGVHVRGLAGQAHPPGEVGGDDVLVRQGGGEVGLQAVGVVAHADVHHLHQPVLFVVDQQVGDPERLAPQVEALVGCGDELQHVGLGHHDLAHRIAQAEGHGLVLGHSQGLRHRLHGRGDLGHGRRGGQHHRDQERPGGEGRQGDAQGAADSLIGSVHAAVSAQTPAPKRSAGTETLELESPWTTMTEDPAGPEAAPWDLWDRRACGLASATARCAPPGERSLVCIGRTAWTSAEPVRRRARDRVPA